MRHWFVILMIALLPLRGWVGDAMAGQMLAQQIEAVQAGAGPHPMMAMPGCPGHSASTGDEGAGAMDASAVSCAGCQVCSSLALRPDVDVTGPVMISRTLPVPGPEAFASAQPAPGFKPPIS